MWKMQDKIEFNKEKYRISARLVFTAQMDTLGEEKISFAQNLIIREHLKNEIFAKVYGHMPRTCETIKKHIKRCENEMRDLGHQMLANKLGSSASLLDSLIDQMTVHRPEDDPLLTRIGDGVDEF